MERLFNLLFVSLITVSCNQRVEEPQVSHKEIAQRYPSSHFWEVDILEERYYDGSYDVDADVIHSVDQESEIISPVNYVINLSEEVVIFTDKEGNIIEEFKVLKRSQDEGVYEYWLEKDKEKHKIEHLIDKDGRFILFTLRNKDTYRVYATKRYKG